MFAIFFVFVMVDYVSSSPTKRKLNGNTTYDGAQVWRSYLRSVRTGRDVEIFNALFDQRAISQWSLKSNHVDYLVHRSQMEPVHHHLRLGHGIDHEVLIKDVQRRLKKRQKRPKEEEQIKNRLGHLMNFYNYQPLKVIYDYLGYINIHYQKCTVSTVGRSLENRPLQMAVVSNNNANSKAILVIAGAHGQEWASVSSVLYVLHELATQFDSLPKHVKDKTWYILPVWNPDGYEYTHTVDRFWRKNRRKFHDAEDCEGVDLNRNFGHNWYIGDFVAYQNPCHETYRGKQMFSEPETMAVKNLIDGRSYTALVDVHSYGQEVVYPWASVAERTPHEATLRSIAEDMALEANKYGNSYKYGPHYHLQYPATGTMIDYAYASGIHYPFIIETRDTGQNGFALPPGQIVSAAQEVQAALYSLAESIDTVS